MWSKLHLFYSKQTGCLSVHGDVLNIEGRIVLPWQKLSCVAVMKVVLLGEFSAAAEKLGGVS